MGKNFWMVVVGQVISLFGNRVYGHLHELL